MPLLLSKPVNPYSSYAVWKIAETEAQLLELTAETPPLGLANKRSEWIVTRILCKYLCDMYDLRYAGVTRLESGKPVLTSLKAEISITHSFPMAAALINTRKPCGIDMEWPRDKLRKIKSKFLHSSELSLPEEIDTLCKVWAAKEVAFKVHGAKNLSLRDEIKVMFLDDWNLECQILKEGSQLRMRIVVESIYNYMMAYNI